MLSTSTHYRRVSIAVRRQRHIDHRHGNIRANPSARAGAAPAPPAVSPSGRITADRDNHHARLSGRARRSRTAGLRLPGGKKVHLLPATLETTQWGWFDNSQAPVLRVNPATPSRWKR